MAGAQSCGVFATRMDNRDAIKTSYGLAVFSGHVKPSSATTALGTLFASKVCAAILRKFCEDEALVGPKATFNEKRRHCLDFKIHGRPEMQQAGACIDAQLGLELTREDVIFKLKLLEEA